MRVGQTCMSLSLSRGWHLKFKWVSRRQHARVWRHASIMWSLHCVQTNACVWDGHACHCHCENFWCQPMLLVQRMHVEQTCKSLSLWEVIDVNVGMRVRLVLLPSLHIEGIGAGKIKQDDSHCLIQLYTEFHPSHSPSHLHCTYSTWIIWENMNFVWFQKSLIISWNNIWHFIFCRQAAVRPHLRGSSTFEPEWIFYEGPDFPELPADDMQVGSGDEPGVEIENINLNWAGGEESRG